MTTNGGLLPPGEGEEPGPPGEGPWEGAEPGEEDGGWEQVGPKNKSVVTRTVSHLLLFSILDASCRELVVLSSGCQLNKQVLQKIGSF